MSVSEEPLASGISGRRVLKGGLIVAAGLGAAQIAGFLRQAALGYLLGTGEEADALSAAMAPVELWWSVSALAVIYGFTPRLAESGPDTLPFGRIVGPITRAGLVSGLVFLIFARPIVTLFAPGLSPETARLAAGLLRVLGAAPAAAGIGFAYSALLLSRRRFILPSLQQAIINATTIVLALGLHGAIGVYGFPVGYVAGAWLQAGLSRWFSRGIAREDAVRAPPTAPKPSLIALLSGPAPILGQALSLELNAAVSRAYASTFGPGMTAAFEYGFKLFRAPMALLVVPLSNSLLPEVSELRGSAAKRAAATRALRRAAAWTFAAAAAVAAVMMLLRKPITSLLFERGEFGAASTQAVSAVLAGYMPVILGRAVLELVSRTLFGMGVYRDPLVAAASALAVNAAVCALLPSAHPALIGLGASLGFLLGAILLIRYVRALPNA